MWQSFAEDTLTACPRTHDGDADVCGAEVKKVFSKVGIAFKGDGFYITDYRSDGYQKAAKADKPSSSGGEGKSKKSDSKKKSSGSGSSKSTAKKK